MIKFTRLVKVKLLITHARKYPASTARCLPDVAQWTPVGQPWAMSGKDRATSGKLHSKRQDRTFAQRLPVGQRSGNVGQNLGAQNSGQALLLLKPLPLRKLCTPICLITSFNNTQGATPNNLRPALHQYIFSRSLTYPQTFYPLNTPIPISPITIALSHHFKNRDRMIPQIGLNNQNMLTRIY